MDATKNAIRPNSTRTHRSQGVKKNGGAVSSKQLEVTSRPTFGATANKTERSVVQQKPPGGASACRRSSISSISELEAVITFHDSKSSVSSISQLTGSSGSFQFSIPGSGPLMQGPSKFDTAPLEKGSTAPKMPMRGGSMRNLDCACDEKKTKAPRMPKRDNSMRQLECGNDSCSSLKLGDIGEEPTSPTCNTSTAGRPWSEGCLSSSQGISMPIREDSVDIITDDSSVWVSGSSSSGLSFYSSSLASSAVYPSSLGTSATDTSTVYNVHPLRSALG